MSVVYSIIIPVYNAGSSFLGMLDSFPKNLKDIYEIIVVDDCSTDETPQLIQNHRPFPQIRFFKTEKNSGPATARNLGAKMARGKYFIFFDADVEFLPDTFQAVETYVEANPEIKCFTGINALESLDSSFVSQFHAIYSYYTLNLIPANGTISTWNPRVGFIERELFLSVGGFDVRYRKADVEDYALSKRILKQQPIRFNPGFCVKHRFGDFWSTTRSFFKRSIQWTHLLLRTGSPDKTGHTRLSNVPSVLISCLIGASFFLYLLISPQIAFWWQLCFLGVFFMLNFRLFRFFLRKVGPPRTLLYSGLVIYYNWVASFGILIGLLTANYKGKSPKS